MPPSVMTLKLSPSRLSGMIVTANVARTVPHAISVMRQLRRNSSRTSPASTRPISTASRTLATERVTSWLWSYQFTSRTPAGSGTVASLSLMSRAIWAASAPKP